MKYQHILVALELEGECNVLIDRAVSMAKLIDAQLSFVHIDGSHGEIYPELVDLQASYHEAPLKKRSVEQLNKIVEYTNYPIEHIWVGTGDLSEKIEAMVKDNKIDLVVCGHHHDFWSRIISYSKHLIDHSPTDILVVPIPVEEK